MESASTLMMFVRLLMSLGVVIGLMWVAATVVRKRGFTGNGMQRRPRGQKGPQVEVELVARKPLSKTASIAVVKIGGRSVVVGVTDHQITNLGEIRSTEIDLREDNIRTLSSGAIESPASPWKTMLDQIRDRTVRR
jgi:flagellar protein FliO/FliZ